MSQVVPPTLLEELKTEILQAIENQHALARVHLFEALESERVKSQEWLMQWAPFSSSPQSTVQTGQEDDLECIDQPYSSRFLGQGTRNLSRSTRSTAIETKWSEETSMKAHKKMKEILEAELSPEESWHLEMRAKFVTQPPETLITRIALSDAFSYAVWTLIIANTIFIGVETNSQALRIWADPNSKSPSIFRAINIFFTSFFSLELALRICAFRCWFFLGDEWRWNLFDFALVLSAIVQEALETASNLTFIRVLRIFRVIRMMRVIRILRMFNELRRMVYAIATSLISLLWAFLLLIIFTYVFSLFIMQGATAYVQDHGVDHENSVVLNGMVGDLFKSMITVIQSFSGGQDWALVASALGKQHKVYEISFVAFVVFTAFGVLNVLTGVFVINSAEIVDRDLLIQQEMFERRMFAQEMKAIFAELDPGQAGTVSWEVFDELMNSKRLQAYFEAHKLDASDTRLLFKLMDHHDMEEIKTSDFIASCIKLRGPASAVHVKKMNAEMTASLNSIFQLVQELPTLISRIGIPPIPQQNTLNCCMAVSQFEDPPISDGGLLKL